MDPCMYRPCPWGSRLAFQQFKFNRRQRASNNLSGFGIYKLAISTGASNPSWNTQIKVCPLSPSLSENDVATVTFSFIASDRYNGNNYSAICVLGRVNTNGAANLPTPVPLNVAQPCENLRWQYVQESWQNRTDWRIIITHTLTLGKGGPVYLKSTGGQQVTCDWTLPDCRDERSFNASLELAPPGWQGDVLEV